MNFEAIVHSLGTWGYLDTHATVNLIRRTWTEKAEVFRHAVRRFKERWGDKYNLSGDDHLDDATVALMDRRFCHCPDEPQAVGEGLRRWGTSNITWRDTGVRVGSLSFAQAMQFTIEQIARACNLKISLATSAGFANIVSGSRRIDGPGRVLAQAYLPGYPSGPRVQLSQEYDTSETNLSQHSFDLVTLHETCHSAGLDHDNTDEIALLDPFLNPALKGLQPADIRQLQARYGPPVTAPPDDPPESEVVTLKVSGQNLVLEIPGYRVTKL